MRALSAPTTALVTELSRLVNERPESSASRKRVDAILSLLASIADAGEPLAIPLVISVALDARREIAEAAGRSVRHLVRLVNVRDLGVFDRAFRIVSPWAHPESARWRAMTAADLRTLAALEAGPTLMQLAMCHPSGYVREEAIRRSAACADGAELPFLLLRTNDWVKPVQDLARAALRVRLAPQHVQDIVNALPMLDAMHRWERLAPTKILDDIEELLLDPAAVAALVTASISPDRFVRRGAYRRLFSRERLELLAPQPDPVDGPYRTPASAPHSMDALIATAMRDPDPAIRGWVGQWLIASEDSIFLAFVDQLLRSRSGALRRAAAERLRAAGAPVPWPDLLLDGSAAVRSLAQAVALDAGSEPDREYRDRLSSSTGVRLGAALVGLSETGGPSDAELVRAYLRSGRPVVRKSALHALANFKVDDLVEVAVAALLDPSPSVTRAARDLLLARIATVRGMDVWSAFARSTTASGKRAALAVLSALGFWECVPHLLRAFDASDEAVRPRVLQYIVKWLARRSRVFVAPLPALANEISMLLGESRLPERMRSELNGVLQARAGAGDRG